MEDESQMSSIVSSSNSSSLGKKKLKIKLSKEEGQRYKDLFNKYCVKVSASSKKVSIDILTKVDSNLNSKFTYVFCSWF